MLHYFRPAKRRAADVRPDGQLCARRGKWPKSAPRGGTGPCCKLSTCLLFFVPSTRRLAAGVPAAVCLAGGVGLAATADVSLVRHRGRAAVRHGDRWPEPPGTRPDEDDFQVLDNDKPQTLVVFDSQSQPITVVVMLGTSGSMTGRSSC